MKKYKIAGKEFTQKPITVGQMKQFSALLQDFNVDENSSFKDLIAGLMENKVPEVMAIILQGPGVKSINWDKVPYDQLDEVIEDFLSLNPRLTRRLKDLLNALARRALASAAT